MSVCYFSQLLVLSYFDRIAEHKVLYVLQCSEVKIVVVHQTVCVIYVQWGACELLVNVVAGHSVHLPYSSANSLSTTPPKDKTR